MHSSKCTYTVYAQVFPNGKAYIGTTSQPLKNRWRNGKGYHVEQSEIHNAIQRTGWDNIEKKILATGLSESDAFAQEEEMIQRYGTHVSQNGYNASTGGKSGAKGTIRSDEWKAALSRRVSGCNHPMYGKHHSKGTREKLSKARRNQPTSEQVKLGRILAAQKTSKAVVCLESGVRYASLASAAKAHNILPSAISISCYNFPNRTAGAVHWQFADHLSREIVSPIDLPPKRNAPKAVECIETGKSYASICEAAAQTGYDPRNISRCCKENGRTTKGAHWRYKSDKSTKD